jgi:hypothetical protein
MNNCGFIFIYNQTVGNMDLPFNFGSLKINTSPSSNKSTTMSAGELAALQSQVMEAGDATTLANLTRQFVRTLTGRAGEFMRVELDRMIYLLEKDSSVKLHEVKNILLRNIGNSVSSSSSNNTRRLAPPAPSVSRGSRRTAFNFANAGRNQHNAPTTPSRQMIVREAPGAPRRSNGRTTFNFANELPGSNAILPTAPVTPPRLMSTAQREAPGAPRRSNGRTTFNFANELPGSNAILPTAPVTPPRLMSAAQREVPGAPRGSRRSVFNFGNNTPVTPSRPMDAARREVPGAPRRPTRSNQLSLLSKRRRLSNNLGQTAKRSRRNNNLSNSNSNSSSNGSSNGSSKINNNL